MHPTSEWVCLWRLHTCSSGSVFGASSCTKRGSTPSAMTSSIGGFFSARRQIMQQAPRLITGRGGGEGGGGVGSEGGE